MTGLAAAFGAEVTTYAGGGAATPVVDPGNAAAPPTSMAAAAIAGALAARGRHVAQWRAGGAHLVARAELPAVHRLPAGALLVDGEVPPGTVASGYAQAGAVGLRGGGDFGAYAAILADLARDTLVLARGPDGPPLYWARLGRAVVAASEPAAVLAAGLPPEPDQAVVRRFLATGRCDDGPATFFAGVRRVLPGQVVEVTRDPDGCRVRVHDPPPRPAPDAAAALAAVEFRGRVGVRLGCGLGAAAVLGSALAAAGRPRPLPVYSTSFPELSAADSSAYCAATLLGTYALGAARHRALPFFLDELDVDGYLADLGEPTPELGDWLCWAIARRVGGEVDTLVDAAAGPHLSRLADRIASRYGVAVRLPLRDLPEPARRAGLAAVVQRTLPSAAAGFAAATQPDRSTDALLPELLSGVRADLVTAFLEPRLPDCLGPGSEPDGLAQALGLLAGLRVDPTALWRRYLVERWLRLPPFPAPAAATAPAGTGAAHTAGSAPVGAVGGWRTAPVRVDLIRPGESIPDRVAWHVAEAAGSGQAVGPWWVLLAAKPVAVAQGRARHLWDLRPGPVARLLHRVAGAQLAAAGLAGRRPAACARTGGRPAVTGLAAPWAVQVALDERGAGPMLAAGLAALLRRHGWARRLAGPAARAVRQPRPGVPPPGQVAVVPGPVDPDRVAAEVVAALKATVPEAEYATLAGCAVLSDQVLGWAPGPGCDAPGAGPGPLAALARADPFGDARTPVALALPAGILSSHEPGAGPGDGSEHAGGVVRDVPAPPGTPGAAGGGQAGQPGEGGAERGQG